MIPAAEEMFTIEPPPFSFMFGMTAFVPKNTPFELTDCTLSHSASEVSSTFFSIKIPALFISMSIFPKVLIHSVTALFQLDSLVTSRCIYFAEPPFSVILDSIFNPSASKMSPKITFAPSDANN